MDNLIIASMTGNFISANFLELRQYSYYVMSKIVFFILYIFLDLLYLIVFFQTSLPNFNIYTSSLAIWETCLNLNMPKALSYNSKRLYYVTFSLSSLLVI
jgi:hypothetical protein